MSDCKPKHKSEGNFRVRPRLWNPNAKDAGDKKRFQNSKVSSLQMPSDDIYLPEDRPQVMITNAIKDEDLPRCITKSECNDKHPAELANVGLDSINSRQKLMHNKWKDDEIKVFTAKYQTLESNKDKKFDLIAKALPDKTAEDCKEFYYLYKHILGFKKPERVRKQKIKERKKSLLELKEPCTSRLRLARKTSEKFVEDDTPYKRSAAHCESKQSLFTDNQECIPSLTSGSLSNLVLLADVCISLKNAERKPDPQLQEEKYDSAKKTKEGTVDDFEVIGKREELCAKQNGNISEKSRANRKRQPAANDTTRMRRAIKRPKKMDL